MKRLIDKYLGKLLSQGLAEEEDLVFLALDAELYSNKPLRGEVLPYSKVFDLMNINSLLFSKPREPYWSIIKEIMKSNLGAPSITPLDCETRTFFHEIPIIDDPTTEAIAEALSKRRSAIIRDRGIVSYGTVTPEQAFVSFSSTCFSTFVKYFYDSLLYFEKSYLQGQKPDEGYLENFRMIVNLLPFTEEHRTLTQKRPESEGDVIMMISEAGKALVSERLVDSYFGNISYVYGDSIYISQTGSSMDELECCIDKVPLDGSSTTGITASSELSAHKNIFYATGNRAILHGHPRFSVIISMYCDKRECPHFRDIDYCYRRCRVERYIAHTPIVSGEIGTGPTGLVKTVPEAMKKSKGVIVFGHGVFASGRDNFQEAFKVLSWIEGACKGAYFETIEKLGVIV